mmetsp:Transcript_112186/g.317345  ORF Transcript_112186/g.317345 Transcript_112186/m.317345 type:complete len:203 (+) Transcript_112186:1182-1790(+)
MSGCAEKYKKAGFSWAFFMGVPSEPGHDLTKHNQGTLDTVREQREEETLLAESNANGDIQFLPFRDQYADLPYKALGLLRFGYGEAQADYVMEHDDDYCADPSALLGLIREHEARRDGTELWAGAEFAGGASPAQYLSGHSVLFSRGLLKHVVSDDYEHSVMKGFYGDSAEDRSLGRWVKYAQDKHGVKVDLVARKNLISDV